MTDFNPGSILINTTNNKLYGVLVATLPSNPTNKIIVFRLDRNTHPIFSKFQLHPHISKVGIINEYQYANLKGALLKHYRTYNLTPTEKQMLKPLMDFAFPLGIPDYQPHKDLPERDIQLMDLHSRIVPGSRIFVNTPIKSSYSHLDGKILDVIEKNEKGVWINLPTNEQDMSKIGNSIHFLFYKNSEIPTFGGISRITPITSSTIDIDNDITHMNTKDLTLNINKIIAEAFKKLKEEDALTTTMEYNGEKVRVVPKTAKVIFPEVFQNMTYSPITDSFTIDPSLITKGMASKLGDKLMIGGKDSKGNIIQMIGADNELVFNNDNYGNYGNDNYQYETKLNSEGELIYQDGGAKQKDKDKSNISFEDLIDIENNEKSFSKYSQYDNKLNSIRETLGNIDDIDVYDFDVDDIDTNYQPSLDDDLSEFISGIMPSRGKEARDGKEAREGNQDSSDNNTMSDAGTDTDIETEYDEDEIVEIIDANDVEELDSFEKVKRVEIDELEKVYPENIQKGFLHKYKTENLTSLQKKDETFLNNITKHINIVSILKQNLTGEDNNIVFKPHDYKPLVSKYIKGDFTNKFLIPLVINRKKIYLEKSKQGQKDEYDSNTNEVIDDYFDNIKNIIHLQDKKNNSLNNDTYTNNIITELNPTSISQTDDIGILFRLGSEIPSDDYAQLCQDTLTIKYCDKPMKCQSYSLNPMNFDYQINLGPMGRFIDDEDKILENQNYENHANKNDGDLREDSRINPLSYNDDDDDEKRQNKNIIYNKPLFKTYYRGDTINIIGYVRPPLKYFNASSEYLLGNMYNIQKEHNEVITININDINPELMDDEDEDKDDENDEDEDKDKDDEGKYNKKNKTIHSSLEDHPDKFVLFLLPQEGFKWNELDTHIDKLIPSIDDLIKLYLDNSSKGKSKIDKTKTKFNNFEHIYNVLDKFNYDYQTISTEIYNKLINKHNETVTMYKDLNEELSIKFEEYKKNLINTIKENEKNKKESSHKKANPKFKYITDDIMQDITKFYYDTYDNKDITIDSDDMRLKWIMKSFDNGKYFFKTLFMNHLKMYQESHNIENLETEMSIIKEKHAMMNTNSQMATSNVMQNGSPRSENSSCNSKITGPNVIKYPSLARLEKDNGKVVTDSDGSVIMIGDYALVDVENSKQLFKRELIGNSDMWIKEDMGVLYKLVQDKIKDKKNKCLANPEIKLEDANKCIFDLEQIKCEKTDMFDSTKQVLDIELYINNLQKEIDYLKHIPVLIANVNKEIVNDRLSLVNKVNSMKNYWKFKAGEEEQLEANNAKLKFSNKPCIHYDVTNYFFRIKNENERYEFASIILKKFLNTEEQYKNDYTNFSRESREKNYTYCNICNQELFCNHFRLGVSYLEDDKPIEYDNIVSAFGTERNGSYLCKVDGCNELIDTTEILDLDDFGKGEDVGRNKTREVTENTPYIDKQKEYLNKMINNLVEGEITISKEELMQRINIFKIIKSLSNIEILSIKDEIEMINFLKTFQFETKTRILEGIVSKIGKSDISLLKKLVDKNYIKYLISDIGARFLITLQTSSRIYQISNKECSTNIIGYPLIGSSGSGSGGSNGISNDTLILDGVNYIMCLFTQISVLPEYSNLADLQRNFLIERIRLQVENDSLVKDKIYNALNNKADDIDSMNSFYLYETNFWKQYAPRLNNINITWSPEKILNRANLKEVTHKTLNKMLEVGRENSIYYSLSLMKDINNIISNSEHSNNKELSNYCCMDSYNSSNPYKYLKFFKKQNTDIDRNIKDFIEVNEIMAKLKLKTKYPSLSIIYDHLFKPSQTIFKLNFNVIPEEIKQIYLKYIDIGLYKGKVHIYDRYNRCVLSNENKADIEAKTYTIQDYKRIESIINSSNQINTRIDTEIGVGVGSEDETEFNNLENIEIVKLNELIEKCPKIETMKFIKDYLVKIKESLGQIFDSQTGGALKNKKPETFDIYRHITNINSQIETEIKELTIKITTTDKNINKYSKIMTNLGNFNKHYEEYRSNMESKLDSDGKSGKDNKDFESEIIYNSNLYRYNKKEEHIQTTIKFLNDVISQLKNGELSNPLNKEHIRPQFREFLQYGENVKLFKNLSLNTREIYNYSRLLKSKHKYKIFFPEMVSSILQYLNIISLVNLFNELDNNKVNKKLGTGEIIDYSFRMNEEPDEALKDLNQDMNLGIEYNNDNEDEENMIESLEIKHNNTNLKIIGGFIISYLDKINDVQLTYDELTTTNINLTVNTHEQKLRTANLKSFEWLSKSGNEMERQLVFLQMHKFKKLKYADLAKYVSNEYGAEFNNVSAFTDYDNEDDIIESDNYEGEIEADNENEYNEDGTEREKKDVDIDMEEMGQVFDEEENDDGDQDYGYQAVNSGDQE